MCSHMHGGRHALNVSQCDKTLAFCLLKSCALVGSNIFSVPNVDYSNNSLHSTCMFGLPLIIHLQCKAGSAAGLGETDI